MNEIERYSVAYDAYLTRMKLRISVFGTPLLVAAAIGAWMSSALLRFANPVYLSIAAAAVAIGVATSCATILWSPPQVKTERLTYVAIPTAGLAIIGLIGIIAVSWDAALNSSRLDYQCSLLMKDMFSAKPTREDSKDLYDALACRPQPVATLVWQNRLPR